MLGDAVPVILGLHLNIGSHEKTDFVISFSDPDDYLEGTDLS